MVLFKNLVSQDLEINVFGIITSQVFNSQFDKISTLLQSKISSITIYLFLINSTVLIIFFQ